jgi:hypothetical protein
MTKFFFPEFNLNMSSAYNVLPSINLGFFPSLTPYLKLKVHHNGLVKWLW